MKKTENIRTAETLHRETGRRLDWRNNPMDAARLVSRNSFAWPGGYLLALVMADGGQLCPDCVKENYRQIYADTCLVPCRNTGWQAMGIDSLASYDPAGEDENGDPCGDYCDHCGRHLWRM